MSAPTTQFAEERRHWLTVQGLDCPDEAAVVRDAVMPLPGAREIIFDYTRSADRSCVALGFHCW